MKATIYKLYNPDYPEFYIGSTKNLKTRKTDHKSCCNNEPRKEYNEKKYKYIREHGGYDSWKYEILEKDEYKDKKHRFEREAHFIKTLNSTLNGNIPGRTMEEYCGEYRKERNEKSKKYYQKHKEKINIKQKIYQEKNKEKISKNKQEYHQKHKDEISKKGKQYYKENKSKVDIKNTAYRKKNKDKVNAQQRAPVECKYCKAISSSRNMSRHRKTQTCLVAQIFHFHFE